VIASSLSLSPCLEGVQRHVHFRGLLVRLGGRAEDGDQSVDLLLGAEPVDVLHQSLGIVHVVGAGLDLIDVPWRFFTHLEENTAGIGLMAAQLVSDPFDVAGVEDTGLHGRGVGVVGVGIPAPELEVVEPGEGDEVLDQRVAASVRLPRRM
jgi:hypothetical protein